MSIRSDLREQVIERSGGRCEWSRCPERGDELAHGHSIGAGGRKSADKLENVAWLCWSHARMSDGEHGEGGRTGYLMAHRDLLGADYETRILPWNVGWERAEALRRSVSDG